MLDFICLPVADHDIRAPRDDWRRQVRHVPAGILIVGIRIDDDIRTEAKAAIHTRLETACKP
jgi:hypothetical protein